MVVLIWLGMVVVWFRCFFGTIGCWCFGLCCLWLCFAVVVNFRYGGCYSGLGFIGNCWLFSGCCAGGLVYLVVCFGFLFSWFCCSLGLWFDIGGFDGTGLFV